MDEIVLTSTRKSFLKEIAAKDCSAQELAKKTKTSIPNVLHQLQILEAQGYLERRTGKTKKPGKPPTFYSLKKETATLNILSKAGVFNQTLSLKEIEMFDLMHIRLLMLNQEERPFIKKFFYMNEPLIRTCQAIGLFHGKTKDIELLVITENLGEVRATISNQMITWNGKDRKVIVWSHNLFEMEDGLTRQDQHFQNFKGKIDTLYDPQGIFNLLGK
jgi:predicted transcriptional regulator